MSRESSKTDFTDVLLVQTMGMDRPIYGIYESLPHSIC
ncbi:hypothetical protein LEP1GSC202_0478 [Leptospira yanagawae serovar Saopaulo str. Sao Paulo = ATCC 700523]|uniref:Uncharacterized protein n=1 Tax=Leptospira yanagawae serovar Saopaulo str. Sao Paulo = ATCC 700523 TaxID=1249483 RepID=A0A5E8HHM2_9LEPT|nr:hypothetical protein LEP1GSC202_0478 [Leptospira yanagawae serovar Saopaulo str. Sao Paulo = ATCC 700523]